MVLPHRTTSSYQLNKKETLDQHKAVLSIISTSNSKISPSKRRNLKNTLISRRYSRLTGSPEKVHIVSSSPSSSVSPVKRDLINNLYNNYNNNPSRESSPVKSNNTNSSERSIEYPPSKEIDRINSSKSNQAVSSLSSTGFTKIKPLNKDDFDIGLKLGKGKFGKVY